MAKGIDPNLICVGCMQPLKKELGVCPHCGMDNRDHRNTIEQLPIRTILNGKYLIGRALGQGGYGITYLGMDLNLEVKLAIKEYYPGNCAARQSIGSMMVSPYSGEAGEFFVKGRERFLDEAKTLAKLKDLDGVVGVRDYFEANGTAYIVMEFVEGRDLKTVIDAKGRQSVESVLALFKPLIENMCRIHEKDVIHRDISPDNIMIRPDGRAVLLDFGAARAYLGDQQLSAYSTAVKNGFAPPEQYQNEKQGPWTDVYAMCATMYTLTTGVVPTQSLARLAQQAELATMESLGAKVPAWFEETLRAGMEIEVSKRIQSMDELYKRLYERKVEQDTLPQKNGGTEKKTRKPWVLLAVAAALLLMNLGQAAFWLLRPASSPAVVQAEALVQDLSRPLAFGSAEAEKLVRTACGKESGSIMAADVAEVTTLSLKDAGLTDVSFLRAFTGLMNLDVSGNRLADLSPIAGLTLLQRLDASHNAIVDLAPLQALTGLEELWLHDNCVTDASPLSGLTKLTNLDLSANRLTDVSALSSLTQLKNLWLQDNSLDGLNGVSALTGLTLLNAGNNRLADVAALTDLRELRTVYLYNNAIADDAPLAHVRAQADGLVDVEGNPCAK